MKKLIILLTVFLTSTATFANNSARKNGIIKGEIKDINTNIAIEYATISLYNKIDSKLVDGTITDKNGFFVIKKLIPGNYYLEISFIGYEKKTIPNLTLKTNKKTQNIGLVKLNRSATSLNEVVVNSDENTIDYKIDKKIISVSNKISASGGTAVDVLETVPSVSVDMNGNVSLRGSTNFKVLVDGRPSMRSAQDILSQIPSNQIKNIEIITNPSAKYDAEGEAGIINIINKKSYLKGSSGFVNVAPGNHDNMAASGMYNLKKKKSSFYLGASYNQRAQSGKRNNYQTTFTDPKTFRNTTGKLNYKTTKYNLSTAYDYKFNAKNSLSITAKIGRSDLDKKDDLIYDSFKKNSEHKPESNLEKTDSETDYYEATVNYIRKFKKKGHHLNTFFDYSGRNYEKTILNKYSSISGSDNYHSFLKEDAKGIILSSDYTLPLNGKRKLQAGYKLLSYKFDVDRNFKENDVIKSEYTQESDFKKTIHSLYGMYSGKVNKFSYKIGLRAEHINRENKYSGETYKVKRWDLFPSAHTQLAIGKKSKLSANYSRRIKRPTSAYLEGFEVWNDTYNRTKGNPNLKPELINSFELSYNTKINKHTISFDAYYRSKKDKIERIKTISNLDPNVIITSFENIGKDYTYGLETFVSLSVTKWWRNLILIDLAHYKIEGEYANKYIFSTSSTNYTLRNLAKFNLSKLTQFQIDITYKSKLKWAQGEKAESFITTTTLKHSFFKRKLSASFIVRDIFNTSKLRQTYYNKDFNLVNNYDQRAPTVKLSLSYKFNKYRGKRRKSANINSL